MNFVKLNNNRWICIYSALSPKDKKRLTRYFSTIYPREYVRKLVAALESDGIQFKES